MTQDRRITDKLPGHSLQWDDTASPAAAPAAGQAELVERLRKASDNPGCTANNMTLFMQAADEIDRIATLAAPVAASSRDMLIAEAVRNECLSAAHDADPKHEIRRIDLAAIVSKVSAPVAADTEQATDELSDEEQAALDRLDKPEWRAASHLKLRAVLAVEVSNSIRMGAKIENLQDELRATEGYRRGYTDGTTDAAGMADVQNDWRGIWDEAPVQGEGVLATDGATVIAARWFATGWAKHDHFSDELEYLPEGWVTHWKPFPPAQDANAQGGK